MWSFTLCLLFLYRGLTLLLSYFPLSAIDLSPLSAYCGKLYRVVTVSSGLWFYGMVCAFVLVHACISRGLDTLVGVFRGGREIGRNELIL